MFFWGDGGDVDGVCGVRWDSDIVLGLWWGLRLTLRRDVGGLAPLIGVFLKKRAFGADFCKKSPKFFDILSIFVK